MAVFARHNDRNNSRNNNSINNSFEHINDFIAKGLEQKFISLINENNELKKRIEKIEESLSIYIKHNESPIFIQNAPFNNCIQNNSPIPKDWNYDQVE